MPGTDGRRPDGLTQIDYDIHGLVGVRLIDPSPSDIAAVEKQLGPLQKPLSRKPDLLLRFVEHLPTPGLKHLGLESGFTDDGCLFLYDDAKKSKVRMLFGQIGTEECEIVCETGLRSVPLLTTILNLTILKKDHVAVHASGFIHKGTGILATGWSKGGKTEALLAFALHGAEYIGDEWVWLSGDGERMYGIPRDILLWNWQLGYLPHLRGRVSPAEHLMFSTIKGLDKIERMIPNARLNHTFPARLLHQAMPLLRRRLYVEIAPGAIFGAGAGSRVAKPEKVFLLMGHEDPMIHVGPMDPLEIAQRMAWSIQYEQTTLMAHFIALKFAFPGLQNRFIDNAPDLQSSILRRALARMEGYTVHHPYPVSLPKLYEAMEPFSKRTL